MRTTIGQLDNALFRFSWDTPTLLRLPWFFLLLKTQTISCRIYKKNSRTAQSFDCATASRSHFAHAPPRRNGPRSYPLCSSDSEHSRGKTLVFPRLKQFSVPKLSCQMNFFKMMNFQLTPLSKIFPKPCMFLPLLCRGTILAPTCPVSCQLSCSSPPSSWSVGAAWFHPFSRSMTAPTQSCAAPPLLNHQSRVAGQGGHHQPP